LLQPVMFQGRLLLANLGFNSSFCCACVPGFSLLASFGYFGPLSTEVLAAAKAAQSRRALLSDHGPQQLGGL
jgi:hypothetical protein